MSEKMEKTTKHIASISLGAMAIGFAATLPYEERVWGSLLHGAFEAGLVGGLADWFAVTALFRHPLGIPIPHTSLLTRNREKLTKALVSAVENELLNRASIEEKLKGIRVTERALDWAEKELASAQGQRAIAAASAFLVDRLPWESIEERLVQEARKLLMNVDTGAVFARLTDTALERGWDSAGLDFLLDKAQDWIMRSETRDLMGALALKALNNVQLGGFMGFAVGAFSGFMTEEKLGGLLQSLALTALFDLRHSGSAARQNVLRELGSKLRELGESPAFLAELEQWKERLAEGEELERRVREAIQHLRSSLERFVRDESYPERFAVPYLTGLIRKVRNDPEWTAQAEAWVKDRLFALIERNHAKLGALVKENVDKLDNRSLIEMLETKVGKDLQWIRVNGALCGFLIGLALAGIRLLL